jgi:thiopeptide-type bacteriocin biosynthesis protein
MAGRAPEWLQLNVALARREGSALSSARFIFRDLERTFPREGRGATLFFFQRKPPDLRLRFFGAHERVVRLVRPLMSRAKSEGHIVRSFYSAYEPEYRQFGGRACMRSVHAFWSADTLAWIAMDRLVERGAFATPHATLIAAVLDDLFWRVLADRGEVWDTWCNLVTLVQCGPATADVPVLLPTLETILGAVSAAEAELVARYQQANAALAVGLSRAWQSDRMECGVRSILPYVALFTLNRHGFDQAGATAIAGAMAAVRNPKQHLRGAQLDSAGAGAGELRGRAAPRRPTNRTKANDGC